MASGYQRDDRIAQLAGNKKRDCEICGKSVMVKSMKAHVEKEHDNGEAAKLRDKLKD